MATDIVKFGREVNYPHLKEGKSLARILECKGLAQHKPVLSLFMSQSEYN